MLVKSNTFCMDDEAGDDGDESSAAVVFVQYLHH